MAESSPNPPQHTPMSATVVSLATRGIVAEALCERCRTRGFAVGRHGAKALELIADLHEAECAELHDGYRQIREAGWQPE